MRQGGDLIEDLLRDAQGSGEETAPTNLLRKMAARYSAKLVPSDTDEVNALFDTFNKDFGFIAARITGKPLDAEDRMRWVGLLRWMIRIFSAWQAGSDTPRHVLGSLLIAAQSCDRDEAFWDALPDDIQCSSELIDALEEAISGVTVDFSVRSIGQTPLWEQEAIARLNQADAQEDWKEIAERWHPFEPALLPDIFLRQAVRCLNHFDLAALVRTVENVRRTPLAMTLVKSLSATQRLRVAIASDNAFIQFSSAYTTVAKSPRRNDLAPEEAQLLTDLLIKVAGDHSRWTSWMHVFNRYPVRYPALQGPLGAALARAPDTAVGAYTDSIALSLSSDQSRQDVSQCLCTFRASATPERRKMLWTSAHQRWRKWAFDADDPERYMGKIEHSALDYPVVGYALECLDIAGRELALSEIRNDLTVIDDKWYISETQCLASWLRLLSLFQPYAHASNIAESEEDWLSATKIYRPFEPSKNPYVTMKFGGG